MTMNDDKQNAAPMDADVRKLWKSFPWIGWGVTALFAGLIARYLVSGSITIGGSGQWQSTMKEVTWQDSPLEFSLVILFMSVLLCGALFYCGFRMRRRNRYRREDGDVASAQQNNARNEL